MNPAGLLRVRVVKWIGYGFPELEPEFPLVLLEAPAPEVAAPELAAPELLPLGSFAPPWLAPGEVALGPLVMLELVPLLRELPELEPELYWSLPPPSPGF